MSNLYKKIQKASEDYAIKKYYENMTPKMYEEGIQRAIKITEERCLKQYEAELKNVTKRYNDSIRTTTIVAMDTLTVEIIYELGRLLECYVKEPENLDQKIDLVQGIYETAMTSISDYGGSKYKSDKQAQKVFDKKKKLVQKIFKMKCNKI